MIEKITVTKYKAKDGTLHDTEEQAVVHTAWKIKSSILNELKLLVQGALIDKDFYSLRNTNIADGSQNWYDNTGADQFTDEVAGFVYKYWDKIYPIMKNVYEELEDVKKKI